jgi:hypothetical protein
MNVQQELMRHADIRITMSVYGKAMEKSKRGAHGSLVRIVMKRKLNGRITPLQNVPETWFLCGFRGSAKH